MLAIVFWKLSTSRINVVSVINLQEGNRLSLVPDADIATEQTTPATPTDSNTEFKDIMTEQRNQPPVPHIIEDQVIGPDTSDQPVIGSGASNQPVIGSGAYNQPVADQPVVDRNELAANDTTTPSDLPKHQTTANSIQPPKDNKVCLLFLTLFGWFCLAKKVEVLGLNLTRIIVGAKNELQPLMPRCCLRTTLACDPTILKKPI